MNTRRNGSLHKPGPITRQFKSFHPFIDCLVCFSVTGDRVIPCMIDGYVRVLVECLCSDSNESSDISSRFQRIISSSVCFQLSIYVLNHCFLMNRIYALLEALRELFFFELMLNLFRFKKKSLKKM